MCLAVPGQIVELLDGGQALVDFMGVKRKVVLDLLEKSAVGEYVIVHAGFAINTLQKEEALETLKYFREISEDLK